MSTWDKISYMNSPELLTKKEVAELLRSSIATVDRLMRSKKVKYLKLEKKVLFRKADIESFIKETPRDLRSLRPPRHKS